MGRVNAAELSFQMPKASLVGSYYDRGVDTDGDSKYDFLAIEITLNITDPGTYQVCIENLQDPTFQIIHISNETISTLSSGFQNITVWLRTTMMVVSGLDGPYTLLYVELTDTNTYSMLDYAKQPYTTHFSYRYTDFDPPGARLTGAYYDIGLDTDGDSTYNFLAIIATLNVSEAGNYDVVVDLHARSGIHLVQNDTYGYLTEGLQNVTIWLNGAAIYKAASDGPYQLDDVAIYDEFNYYHDYYDYNFLDWQKQSFITGHYSFTDFDKDAVGVDTPPNSSSESRWLYFIKELRTNTLAIVAVCLGMIVLVSISSYVIIQGYLNKTQQSSNKEPIIKNNQRGIQSIKTESQDRSFEQKRGEGTKSQVQDFPTLASNKFTSVLRTSILLQEKLKKLNGNMITILFILIDHHPTLLTHSELVDLSNVGKSTLTYSLTRLEHLGFIHRRPRKEDFRFIEVGLTPQGMELVTELRQRIEITFLNDHQSRI
ncbi:MAG: MarR family winged helix-turn-helix transcriptional regulator [Candidatus Hodarchaeota archaeon]